MIPEWNPTLVYNLFLPRAFFSLARADKDSATGNQMSAKRFLVVAAVFLLCFDPERAWFVLKQRLTRVVDTSFLILEE